MNFLTNLGLGANNANQGIEQSQKIQQSKMALQQLLQQQKASQVAGSLFPGMMAGDPSAAPPSGAAVPGATSLPWKGGLPNAAGAPTGLPNGGAPPVPGASPMPPPTGAPMGAPPAGAGGGMPTAGGSPTGAPPSQTGGLSWQALAAQIKKQAPDADGATIMGVIQQYAPLMNQQSKQSLQETLANAKMLGMQFAHEDRQDAIQGANDRSTASNGTKVNVAKINQDGANGRAKDRLGASGGVDLKTAMSDQRTAQSNMNSVRANGSAAEKAAAQKQLDAANAEVQAAKKGGTGIKSQPLDPAKPQYSQEDLEHTAKVNNMTVDEVKAKLGVE